MQINPVVTQANGVISIRIQALFIGDVTDATDKANIAAFGDPQVSLVGTGTFVASVPNSSPPATFTFQFPTSQYYVGITTQLSAKPVRFMTALPSTPPLHDPNAHPPEFGWEHDRQHHLRGQGPLDCITPYPAAAAEAWWTAMQNAISTALTALRAQALVPPLTPVDV